MNCMRGRLAMVGAVLLVLACCGVAGMAGSTADAADWLASQQDAAGWFPWTPGGGATTNTQGPSGLGILSAYLHTKTSGYLLSATDNGDYMLDPMWVSLSVYTDGDPRFATHDPLFMESLTVAMGDLQYADFVQANFWDKLAAGTYGESNDLDAAGFGAAVVNGRNGQGIVELSPWDLSATAIAAHLAGEYATRDALMGAVLDGLAATTSAGGFDVIGLAGAVWASAMTGIDLDPATGVYAGADSTADLAATLAGFTLDSDDGAWLCDSTVDASDDSNADTQTTAFAIAALNAFDRATYVRQIARGVTFIRSLQQADGQFLCYPGAPLDDTGSVEVNAEAISAIVYAAPPTVYVDDDFAGLGLGDDPAGDGVAFGYDAFDTIQDGVDGVAGSTVNVAPGIYTPAARITIDNVGLLLVGPQAGIDPRPSAGTTRIPGDASSEAIIDGGGMSTILYIDADDVLIEGLEIRNGSGDLITSPSSTTQYRPVVRYNIIHGSSGDEGIQLKNVVDAVIEYNHVYDTGGDGINIGYDSVGGTIQYNEVHDIDSPDGAIYVYGTPNVTIKGNVVYNVHNNDGIKLGSKNGADAGQAGGLIQQNIVYDTAQDGIAIYMSHVDVEGNEVSGSSSENGAIYLAWAITDVSLIGNVVHDNTLDPGKRGTPAGILIGTAVDAADITIHYNSISGNAPFGLTNLTGMDVDAALNWWGAASGASHASNPAGTGDAVSDNVIYSPWLGTNPDGDAGTIGVQVTAPMLIVVDDVGPEPETANGNRGYMNQAIFGSNELPYVDTIEVRHGTYDASEPITDGVEIVSEVGSAAHTTLTGPITIDAPEVLLGRIRQGFTVTGPITVGTGVDATTIHINWNDLYDLVTNNGDGMLDATFNYWGEDGPDTVGLVNVNPLLPESSDTIVGYMDGHRMNAAEAIAFSHYLKAGYSVREALIAMQFSSTFGGFSMEELDELIDEYGAGAVRLALNMSGGDWDKFLQWLIGYGIGGGGGGALLGGGGGGSVSADGLSVFVVGELVPLELELFHPISGEPVTDATVSYTVTRTTDDGAAEVVAFGVLSYDGDVAAYTCDFDTTGLEPGVYDIYVGTGDGKSQHFQIEIVE